MSNNNQNIPTEFEIELEKKIAVDAKVLLLKSSLDKIEGFEDQYEYLRIEHNCKVFCDNQSFDSAWQAIEYVRCKTCLDDSEAN